MQALILAGGAGTRLRPLTSTVPKPVLPLAGRPHIAYVIDWLERHGVGEVIVSCGHLADGVRSALDGLTDLKLDFAEEPDTRGTAGAIRFAEEMLGDRFLVLNGDVLCDLDLTAQIEQHERTGAIATLALHPVDDLSAYGLVRRASDGEITDFLEKPDPAEIDTDEINAGAYVLERAVLDLIPPDREVSIEREVFPKLVGNGLYGRRLEGYWIDIGRPDRYLQANWDILERRVETVRSEELGADGSWIADSAQVSAGATLNAPVFIDEGVEVAAGATIGPRAVLGPGTVVGEGAAVESSVLLATCTVGSGARLRGAILASHVEVAAGAEPEPGSVVGEGGLLGAAA
ncbi:MAG TPA: NDP-sugar synthase [Solirubrobacterales bacterium]|nr:NDP-sugar synthase [Solirubrobacterales bacterium]